MRFLLEHLLDIGKGSALAYCSNPAHSMDSTTSSSHGWALSSQQQNEMDVDAVIPNKRENDNASIAPDTGVKRSKPSPPDPTEVRREPECKDLCPRHHHFIS